MAVSKSQTNQLRIEYLPLAKLLRAPRNPKRHDVGMLHESLQRFGYVAPIVLNEKTGKIVAGHGRLEALQRAKAQGHAPPKRITVEGGEWLVPVVRGAEFATEQEAEAYLLADNKLVELGGWDESELSKLLAGLAGADALSGTGFDGDDVDELLRGGTESETLLSEAVQLNPTKDYLVVTIESEEDAVELRKWLGLQLVRRAGYKKGSPFAAQSTERVVLSSRLLRARDAHCHSK